jgi:CheY-like chemotaxis protein
VNGPAELDGPAVLVVDDEVGMRDTMVAILEHHGYRVSSAPDGETAFSAVQAKAFDVLVMDIRMPGRDGVSVLQEIGMPPQPMHMSSRYSASPSRRAEC